MTVIPAPDEAVRLLSTALVVRNCTLTRAVAVEVDRSGRSEKGTPRWIVAAEFSGPEFTGQIGVWAMGHDLSEFAPAQPVNTVALQWSDLGQPIDPDSPQARLIEAYAEYPECAEALGALGG